MIMKTKVSLCQRCPIFTFYIIYFYFDGIILSLSHEFMHIIFSLREINEEVDKVQFKHLFILDHKYLRCTDQCLIIVRKEVLTLVNNDGSMYALFNTRGKKKSNVKYKCMSLYLKVIYFTFDRAH